MVHGAQQGPKGPQPVRIGANVSVGEGAILHGCQGKQRTSRLAKLTVSRSNGRSSDRSKRHNL